MILPLTISRYIGRLFTLSVLATLGALALIVALFDYIELLRRATSQPGATMSVVAAITAMRLPFVVIEILPFGVLVGGIVAFWRLARSSELVVARAAGLSAWEFLAAPTACALLLGAFATFAISPVSAILLTRAEALDTKYLRTTGNTVDLNGNQLWLRQLDSGLVHGGVAILHVRKVTLKQNVLGGTDVSVFRLDGNDALLQRIQAPHIVLQGPRWRLDHAHTIAPDRLPGPEQTIVLPTDLTLASIQEGFASPDTLSFWDLPGFIALLKHSGFSTIRHRLHFQSLLALPLLAATMALVAAGFSMRPSRRGGAMQMIGGGVASGFALFFVSKVAVQFGDSGVLPTVLAAWAPALAGLLLALTLLLHLEDG